MVVGTTGNIRRAKLQSNHHQQTNTQFFTGQMPFLSPNQQCRSTEGKNITFHGLAYPKLTWGLPTLSLTTNSYWLPGGRVAMPLISPLMPVPQYGVLVLVPQYGVLANVGMENAERINDGPNSRAENKRYDRQTLEKPNGGCGPILLFIQL